MKQPFNKLFIYLFLLSFYYFLQSKQKFFFILYILQTFVTSVLLHYNIIIYKTNTLYCLVKVKYKKIFCLIKNLRGTRQLYSVDSKTLLKPSFDNCLLLCSVQQFILLQYTCIHYTCKIYTIQRGDRHKQKPLMNINTQRQKNTEFLYYIVYLTIVCYTNRLIY